jgi:hypothetical protein
MKFDTKLLNFSDEAVKQFDYWTLEDAFKGVQIFGGIGSGKSSGSGKTLAETFLKKSFGGLILCAKPDEREFWEKLASKTGRSKDLLIFREKKETEDNENKYQEYFFNPLDYEAKRLGGGETFNIVNLFMQIYQMGRVISGEGMASGGDRFWDNAVKRGLSRMIDLLKYADENVTIANMYRLISQSLSKNKLEYFTELRKQNSKEAYDRLEAWKQLNYYVKCYLNSVENLKQLKKEYEAAGKSLDELFNKDIHFTTIVNYFEKEFANLAERTKSIILESFLGLTEPFQSGILEKYFSGKTTISPEDTFEKGKIIILDFPIKNYLDAGIYAQGLFKLMWQQAVERRKYEENDIPVFLWVDESHNFLSGYDQIFQTTARSAGVCTVFITQNISNYYVSIGGRNSNSRVNSLLGNLSTKIFHANNDAVTNEWASKTIGKTWKNIEGFSSGQSQSFNLSKQFHWEIEPSFFTKLKSGGKRNEGIVQAVVVTSRSWSNDKNYLIRSFKQF